MDYQEFLASRRHTKNNGGFKPLFIPDFLFDFQKELVSWSIETGRSALFEDCGLGKTPQFLVWSENVVRYTNKPVLILTPLSVSYQIEKEGVKFGIDVKQSRDGFVYPNITVTNYEKLHLFNHNDFSGLVLDECFTKNTPIDVLNIDGEIKTEYIQNLQRGDKIINAYGVDEIDNTYKRQVNRAVQISYNGRKITCSENHPFFTLYGWKCAQDIQPGDHIMATRSAMCMVRGNFYSEICSSKNAEILQSILFSEMEDEAARNIKSRAHKRSSSKNWKESFCMVEEWYSWGEKADEENKRIKPDVKPRNEEESFTNIAADGAQTFRSWGEWSRNDIAAAINEGCVVRELDTGICYITGKTTTRFSNMLQSRLRKSRLENSNRNRWSLPQDTKNTGHKEGQETGFFRVENSEILELGDSRLDEFRNANGELYFYDIKAKRHPSFSVNGALVHNSSILKNFDGKIKAQIIEFIKKIQYRLLATATAAPNDYFELGNSSEALGAMGYMDMLNRFFKNNQKNANTGRYYGKKMQWVFKKHAEPHFWRFVTSWARAIRKPSDIGFDDGAFVLPGISETQHIIDATKPKQGEMFASPAIGLKEQRAELKETTEKRCEAVANIIPKNDPFVCWCNTNQEGDLMESLIQNAVQIAGKHTDEQKEARFKAFQEGEIQGIITKPKIGGMGLNLQHCAFTTFFPSHSYEQFYQCVRRFYRFGQKRQVQVHVITTPGMESVLNNLQAKERNSKKMFDELVKVMNNPEYNKNQEFNKNQEVPAWL